MFFSDFNGISSPVTTKLIVSAMFSLLEITAGSIPDGKLGTLSTAFLTSAKTTLISYPFKISTEIFAEFSDDVDVTLSTPTNPFKLSSIFKTIPSSISCGEAPG